MKLNLFRESLFRLDGGAMFGHVPKVVWSKLIATDESNRIQLSCHPMIVQHPSGRIILIETGMGPKWGAKEAALYALESTPIEAELARQGLTAGDVTDVLLTHLHLDHAGGATRLDASGTAVPAFPNATYHVQRSEYDVANRPDMRSRPSYRAENIDPITAAGRWNFLEGDTELMPGIRVRVTPGHTRWHQSILLETPQGPVWYLGDIVPTSRHAKPHYVMGYDLFPLDVMASRSALFEEAMAREPLLIFEHDPDTPVGRLRRDGKSYVVEPEPAALR